MKILDCESVASAYQSIEQIFNTDRKTIKRFFRDLAPNEYSRNFLLSNLEKQIKTSGLYDGVCWFHFTRTSKDNTFEEGILPLGQQLNSIWNSLFNLLNNKFPEEEWESFRRSLEIDYKNDYKTHFAHLYRLKIEDSFHWGPYGFLIREMGFMEGLNHYTKAPEIIEDICSCFEERCSIKLLQLFKQNTQPCIVKFIEYQSSHSHVGDVLHYLYETYCQRKSQTMGSIFHGDEAITKDRILKIEFLKSG